MANEDNNNRNLGRNGKSSLGRRTFLGAAGAGAVTTTLAGCLGGVGGDDDDGIFKIGHLAPTGMAMGSARNEVPRSPSMKSERSATRRSN